MKLYKKHKKNNNKKFLQAKNKKKIETFEILYAKKFYIFYLLS